MDPPSVVISSRRLGGARTIRTSGMMPWTWRRNRRKRCVEREGHGESSCLQSNEKGRLRRLTWSDSVPGGTRVVAIPGQLLTDAQAGQREAHLVRDNGCNRVAVERSDVEPEHRAGGEPAG